MKKCLLLIIVLLPSLRMAAQNLSGSWEEKENSKALSSLIFKQNGTMSLHIFIEKAQDDGTLISGTLSVPGSYTRAGQMVYIRFASNKLTINYDDKRMQKISEEERAAALYAIELYRQSFSANWPQSATMRIKSITAKEMVVELLGQDRKYRRVASH